MRQAERKARIAKSRGRERTTPQTLDALEAASAAHDRAAAAKSEFRDAQKAATPKRGEPATPGALLAAELAERRLQKADERAELATFRAQQSAPAGEEPRPVRLSPAGQDKREAVLGAKERQRAAMVARSEPKPPEWLHDDEPKPEPQPEQPTKYSRAQSAPSSRKFKKPRRTKAQQAERDQKAHERWEERFMRKARDMGWRPDAMPKLIPRDVWVMAWQICTDKSGYAARHWLKRLRARFSGWALAPLREAATRPLPDGRVIYNWGDDRTRRLCAFGLMLLRLSSKLTWNRGFGSRSTREGRCVRGIPRGAFASALRAAWETDAPCKNTISNYISALRDTGFLHRAQLPVECVERFELGAYTGHAFNRYWLPMAGRQDAQPVAGGGMRVGIPRVDDAWMGRNLFGWEWMETKLVRPPRGERRELLRLARMLAAPPPPPD